MKKVSDNRVRENSGKEVYLVTASNEREYDVYKSLLDAYGIPFLKKQREAGGYLNISMGMNIYGVDIYVPEEYYDDAAELIKGTENAGDDSNGETKEAMEEFHNKRLMYIWIIIAIFYIPVLILMLYRLIKSI